MQVDDDVILERAKGAGTLSTSSATEIVCRDSEYYRCTQQTSIENHVVTAPSTSSATKDVNNEKAVLDCNLTNKFCTTHGQKLDSTKVTKRIWKDRGKGKGFGYVSTKITKYFCNPRTRDLKTSNFSDAKSVSQSQEDKLGGLIRK